MIGFIGGGHITEIIIGGLVAGGADPSGFMCSDINPGRLDHLRSRFGIRTTGDNLELVRAASVVVIAVLPQAAGELLATLRGNIPAHTLIISVMAGVPLSALNRLGDRLALIRMGPNPPAQVGMSITAIVPNRYVTDEQLTRAIHIASSLGPHLICSEQKLDIILALFSPAPVYLFAEAMVDAGVRAGLTRDESTLVVRQTIAGSMAVWEKSGLAASTLREQASTPGGVSVEMLHVLDRAGVRGIVSDCVRVGVERCLELGRKGAESF